MSFEIFGLQIYYYGVIIAFGILAAFIVGLILLKKLNYKEDFAYLVLLICVPLGIIGARVYYVIFADWSQFKTFWDVINIRGGGMAIYGGIIGAALGLLAVVRFKKCGFFTVADLGVICLLLAQGIGRWGNYANGELYGFEVSTHIFPFTVEVGGQAYLGLFFYEFLLNIIGFVFLLLFFFKKRPKWGTVTALYLIWYGVTRAVLEPLRQPEYSLLIFGDNPIFINRISFVISLAIVAAGVLLLWAVKKGWISQENKQCLNTSPTDTAKAK